MEDRNRDRTEKLLNQYKEETDLLDTIFNAVELLKSQDACFISSLWNIPSNSCSKNGEKKNIVNFYCRYKVKMCQQINQAPLCYGG